MTPFRISLPEKRGQPKIRSEGSELRASSSLFTPSRTENLNDSANLPPPDLIAAEIVEDLQAALVQFAEIANDLKSR